MVETVPLPIPPALEHLPRSTEAFQFDSTEESSIALAKELMVQLQAVMPFLELWGKHLEANKDKVLFGELHPYPKGGKQRWNYYLHSVDADPLGKDKRCYVRPKDLESYQKAISLGKQLKKIQPLKRKVAAFLDEMQSLL